MNSGDERQRELGALLRRLRESAPRAPLGLPPLSGRTSGLRREEVATFASISVTWYSWLEQGRDVTPSRQVLDAVARTLGASQAEHRFMLSLAGHAVPDGVAAEAAPMHVQRLLDAQTIHPSYAMTTDWTIVAWNNAYARFCPVVVDANEDERNLLRLNFTDPYVRALTVDWDEDVRRVIAEYRSELGARLHTPGPQRLVGWLLEHSAEFRSHWEAGEVAPFASRYRRFRHPRVGELLLEQHRMTTSDDPGLHVVVYLPADSGETSARLEALAAEGW